MQNRIKLTNLYCRYGIQFLPHGSFARHITQWTRRPDYHFICDAAGIQVSLLDLNRGNSPPARKSREWRQLQIGVRNENP